MQRNMFGRRAKTSSGSAPTLSPEAATEAPTDLVLDERVREQPASDIEQPIRAAGSGQDSGLASIEAEFTISDADLELLDLASIAFEQEASRLSAVDSILAEHQAVLDAYMTQLNEAWTQQTGGPVDIRPYRMIPERCWEDEHREVLVEVLGLAPSQAWNILPLAGDPATAQRLGIALHPGARALDCRQAATTLIADAIDTMQSTVEQATFASATVDANALDAARALATSEIIAVARRMAGPLVGAEAVDHVRATFFGD